MHDHSRVFIIAPDPLERRVLREALNVVPKIDVLGAAANLQIATRQIKFNRPDALIICSGNSIFFNDDFRSYMPLISNIAIILYVRDAKEHDYVSEFTSNDISPIVVRRSCDRIYDSLPADMEKISVSIGRAVSIIRRRPDNSNLPSSKDTQKLRRISTNTQVLAKDWVIAIGASTGGTEAITRLLQLLPSSSPGIVVVQHMPADFTGSFARRLNDLCDFNVQEARGGERIESGKVFVANGSHHLEIEGVPGDLYIMLTDRPKVSGHRPSVDVLLHSVAKVAGKSSIGIILTGMGEDGARGLLDLKMRGGQTIAQDEATSVVFGMPRRAFEIGAVSELTPLPKIADRVAELSASI